jgi:hypothetical protein
MESWKTEELAAIWLILEEVTEIGIPHKPKIFTAHY